MYITYKKSNTAPSFPNQNVYNNRFLINHPQLSVNYHQKQMYEQIIREKYNSIYPSFAKPYTLYDSIYKPQIEQKPN
jgi:hypothetical protein